MTLMAPVPRLMDNSMSGSWRVWVYPSGVRSLESAVDVSFVRGAPTMVESLATADPFGPTTASIRFPAVTLMDAIGASDLWWLQPEMDVDIVWVLADGDKPSYRWEGYMASFEYSPTEAASELSVTLRGAMFQMDNYLAKPEYVYQPIPYEVAISRQFTGRPDMRIAPLRTEWPSWWSTKFRLADYSSRPLYMRPVGLEDGSNWSGSVTRSTGSFDQVLTSYVQGLLANMYTARGQFTLALDEGRRPVLRHRDRITAPDDRTLVVDLLTPGVSMSATKDYTQRLNAVYGQGKSLNGSTFSGMQVSADGQTITYAPYAARRQVDPIDENDWFDRSVMRKEVNLSFYEGLSEVEAADIAKGHLARFSDPGVTGTITLTADPVRGGAFFSRYLVTAGMSIQVRGLFGNPDGVMFHVTESNVGPEATELTVDGKYRDQLTVQEVTARTRDSLAPIRLLTVGQYKPNIPDMLFPWSYADGSGFVPKGSQNLFAGMPSQVTFPWVDWTRQRPPRDPQWAANYIRISPASGNADGNWANKRQSRQDFAAYPVRLSQAGEASLFQISAYDQYGSVLKVPFHVSLYRTNGVSYSSMPSLGISDEPDNRPYKAGQHYPFFKRAWEEYAEDGTQLNPDLVGAVSTAQIIIGYGNFYEKAGFWPGTSAVAGAEPTGLLSDSGGFSWDLTDAVYGVDPQRSADENLRYPNRADVYVMVYCDAQLTQDVYFLGRIYRKEPGTA